MAACDLDMVFTFVLAGWPGSVHDMRVFDDAMTTYSDKFPKPPREKYYLVDSGYANRTGFLAPYRQTKYHIQDFQNAPEPQGMKEIFNFAHSSLRNVIERAYGVLKMKWRILLDIPAYPPETQTRIICACMALHNFIRINGDFDSHFGIVDSNINYVPIEGTQDQPEIVPAPESADMASMNAFRDMLVEHLFARS
nr:protein ALP1-like [Setaria viridis]